MADIPAGSLTVKVDASIKPLEDGLNKAKQKVAQADKAIQQTTENTKRGFFEAGGKVKDFQTKLSESLGVIAGFAAAAQLIGGLADGFTAAREAVKEASDTLDALDKGTAAFLQKVPVLNNFANFGRSLAIGLGLATDEVKELQEALEATRREQALFTAAIGGQNQSLANQAQIQELLGNTLEANRLKAEQAFKAQLKQANELRAEARKFAQEQGTSVNEGRAGVAQRQAEELEKQARQIKELTIQAAERAEEERRIAEEAAKAKEEADEARRIAEQQERIASARLAKEQQLSAAIADITQDQQDRLQIAELELQIAQATSQTVKEELQQSLELVKAENALRDASEKVNDLFAERIELAKQSGAAEADLASIERERLNSLDRLKQEFEAKEQQRATELARKRKEEAEALEKQKAEAAKKAAEESAKKQQELLKKIAEAGKNVFDTTIAGFEVIIPTDLRNKTAELAKKAASPLGLSGALPTESQALSGVLPSQEDQIRKLDKIITQDLERNTLLRKIIDAVRDSSTSGAFT